MTRRGQRGGRCFGRGERGGGRAASDDSRLQALVCTSMPSQPLSLLSPLPPPLPLPLPPATTPTPALPLPPTPIIPATLLRSCSTPPNPIVAPAPCLHPNPAPHQELFRPAQLKALVDVHSSKAGFGGTLSDDEIHIICGALDMSNKIAAKSMTPLEKVFMLSTSDKLDDRCLQAVLSAGHSRIPVYKQGNR